MAAKRRPKTPQRPFFLGPAGPGVRITYSGHASERFFRRIHCLGLELQQFDDLIRDPKTKYRDRFDPEEPKIRRYIRLPSGDWFRILFVVQIPATNGNPGTIHIVTIRPLQRHPSHDR